MRHRLVTGTIRASLSSGFLCASDQYAVASLVGEGNMASGVHSVASGGVFSNTSSVFKCNNFQKLPRVCSVRVS